MQLTLRLKLNITAEQAHLLRETAERYTESFNRICQVGYGLPETNSVKLHKLTYTSEKKISGLPSQLTCSARVKAAEALASTRARKKKGKKVSCPCSKGTSIRYDARSSRVRLSEGYATLATVHRRQRVTFSVPDYAKARATWKTCSCDLVLHKNGKLYLHVVVEAPLPKSTPSGRVEAADLGISKAAVSTQNLFYGSKQWKVLCDRYVSLRRILQSKGTRSAKRHLKKLRRKENRFRDACDHLLSKWLVSGLSPGDILVLEDLTEIRSRVKARKEQRRRLHSWSFARLQVYLEYKARLLGIEVVYVDPSYTSQRCSGCGYTDKANRPNQSTFCCKKCHLRLNADLNAARNIRAKYWASVATGQGGGLPVNQPIVPRQLGEPVSQPDTSLRFSGASPVL
jgi:putative transposase